MCNLKKLKDGWIKGVGQWMNLKEIELNMMKWVSKIDFKMKYFVFINRTKWHIHKSQQDALVNVLMACVVLHNMNIENEAGENT